MKDPTWTLQSGASADVLNQPAILVLTIGQLCVVEAALMDAQDTFATSDPSEYPLLHIRAALARCESVLYPEGGEAA